MLKQTAMAFLLAGEERRWRTILLFHALLAVFLVLFAQTSNLYGFAKGYEKIVLALALPFAAGDVFDKERRTGRAQTLCTMGLRPEALAMGVILYRITVFLVGCMLLGSLHRLTFAGFGMPGEGTLTVLFWIPFQCVGVLLLAGLLSTILPGWGNILGLLAYMLFITISVAGLQTLSLALSPVLWALRLLAPTYSFVHIVPGGELVVDSNPKELTIYVIQILVLFALIPFAFRRTFLSPPRLPRLFRRRAHR